MDAIFRFPGRAYDFVWYNFGWFGVLFAGLALAVAVVFVFIWYDRRK